MKRIGVVVLLVAGFVLDGVAGQYFSPMGDSRLQVSALELAAAPVEYAQSGRSAVRVRGGGAQSVMVAAEVSFGKDATALFRPSRWRRPLAPGGVISWINPWAWGAEPYRTTVVLVGELAFVGLSYGVYELFDRDSSGGGSREPAPEPDPAPAPSSGGGGRSTPAPAPADGGGGGGGASSPIIADAPVEFVE